MYTVVVPLATYWYFTRPATSSEVAFGALREISSILSLRSLASLRVAPVIINCAMMEPLATALVACAGLAAPVPDGAYPLSPVVGYSVPALLVLASTRVWVVSE